MREFTVCVLSKKRSLRLLDFPCFFFQIDAQTVLIISPHLKFRFFVSVR